VIRAAYLESMTWDVDYFDGDSDKGICQRCVRPFIEFSIGERVVFNHDDPDLPAPDARIISIDAKEQLYDVQLLNSNQIERKVPIKVLYRTKRQNFVFKKGSMVRFRETSDSSFPVIVLKVNENGTSFVVGSEDGGTWQASASDIVPDFTWYHKYAED